MREFEIKDFLGIRASDRNPPLNASQVLTNGDLRGKYGDITLRPGYAQKYAAPSGFSKLTISSILSFENFYVPDIGGGREVTLAVGKGTVTGQTTGSTYSAPSSINTILFFIRPYWDGSAWQDAWQWLNEMRLTKLHSFVAADHYDMYLDFAEAGSADLFNGWHVYNQTLAEEARVVDTLYGGTRVNVKISNNVHDWQVSNDVILLMRNYLPYSYLTEMYNATVNEISFNKILNDLRVGFGGKENRVAVAIGYRESYLNVNTLAFGGFTDNEVLSFSTVKGIVLTPYTALFEAAEVELTALSGGTLTAGKKYIRVSAVLDNINEVLLNADANITVSGTQNIQISVRLKVDSENKRITAIRTYYSDDGDIYFLIGDYKIRSTVREKLFDIDANGYLTFIADTTELHTASGNAAGTATSGEDNDTTGWSGFYSDNAVASVADVGAGSDYVIRCYKVAGTTKELGCYYAMTGLKANTQYTVDFRAKMVSPASTKSIGVGFLRTALDSYVQSGGAVWVDITTAYQNIILSVTTGESPSALLLIVKNLTFSAAEEFRFDRLSVKETDVHQITPTTPTRGGEMSDNFGYTPTLNLVKSWDQAIVSGGRALAVNPYIEKRHLNKIFFSPVSGDGAFQYDVLTAQKYYDLENFDGNDLIGIEVLPNQDFAAFKRNSVQYLDSRTGRTRNIDLGSGCISRRSIVNFGDKICWAGLNSIYMTDGMNVVDIADKQIREDYRSLGVASMTIIHAVREERDNSYRIYLSDSTPTVKRGYTLTKKGWMQDGLTLNPDKFSITKDGAIWFLTNDNVIYQVSDTVSQDAGANYGLRWKSVPIDINLLGESIIARERIFLYAMWVKYSTNIAFTVNIYLDGNATAYDTFNVSTSKSSDSKRLRLSNATTLQGLGCKFFELEVVATTAASKNLTLSSIGVIWDKRRVPYDN